jgi:transcriptional repressor NrdR
MAGLEGLDHVAYIRFASVYKDFSEPQDFTEIAESVEAAPTLDPKTDRLL